MKEYFKEQLDAGAPNGAKDFMVFYMVEDAGGKLAMLRTTNQLDAFDKEDMTFIRHDAAIPVFKLKD